MHGRCRALIVAFVVVSMLVPVSVAASNAGELPPGGTFSDDNGNIHEGNIEAIAARGITKGCNPPGNDLYCPGSSVTRGEMAAFLVRAMGLPAAATDFFSDDDGSVFEADINRLAAAGITKGCNPPADDLFCPFANVTRGQMAGFLVRTFGYDGNIGANVFSDTIGSVFVADIDRLAAVGVTKGCNPPDNTRFCPDDDVERDQMATLLARALGLAPIIPPPVTVCTAQGSIPEAECDALVTLLDTTGGDEWTDRTGWATAPDPCTWYGVTCFGGSVTMLWLSKNRLSGSMPVELEALTNLILLSLADNQLTGSIPTELGNLTDLKYLYFHNNQLSGPIPTELGNLTDLLYLYLHNNQLSGPIPAELGNLTDLRYLYLANNALSGPVAGALRQLDGSLYFLYLNGQTGCLTSSVPGLADWLASYDQLWNDGC